MGVQANKQQNAGQRPETQQNSNQSILFESSRQNGSSDIRKIGNSSGLYTSQGQRRQLVTAGSSRLSLKKSTSESQLFQLDNIQIPKQSQNILHNNAENQITNKEKLDILKARKNEKETKIRAKLDIYSSIRPKRDQKDMDRIKKQYLDTIDKHSKQPNIDHLYYVIPHQNFQPPQTANIENNRPEKDLMAKLPKTMIQSQQHQRQKTCKITSSEQKQSRSDFENVTTECNTDLINRYTITTPSLTLNHQNSVDTLENCFGTENKYSPTNASRISFSKTINHFKSTSLISKLTSTEQQTLKQKQHLDNIMNQDFSYSEEIQDIASSIQNPSQDFQIKPFSTNQESLTPDYKKMNPSQSNQDSDFCENVAFKLLLRRDQKALVKEIEGVMSLNQRKQIIDKKDSNGRSLLFYAVCLKSYDLCEVLLRNGGDTMQRDFLGRNILHYSCLIGCEKNIVEMIVNYQKLQRSNGDNQQRSKADNQKVSGLLLKDPIGIIDEQYDQFQNTTSIQQQSNSNSKQATPKVIDICKDSKIYDLLLHSESKSQKFNKNLLKNDCSSADKSTLNSTVLNKSPSKSKMQKNLELSSIEALASFSNSQLSQYIYGIYNDNALTYMIRIEDKEKFQYLLKRGVMPSQQDIDGNNALHYAISMERIEFISYLLEGGEYHGYDYLNENNFKPDLSRLNVTINNINANKSYMMGTQSQLNHSVVLNNQTIGGSSLRSSNLNYQIDALLCIDKSNVSNGSTPFHEAAKVGNIKIFEYLVNIVKKRNQIIQSQMMFISSAKLNQTLLHNLENTKSIKEVYEFTDNLNMTPLLIAAKHNNFEILKLLINDGVNVYTQCSKLQNCLHYAVLNNNEEMIKYLIFADAESRILINECNYRNLNPEAFDCNRKFTHLFQNIWEICTQRTQTGFEKLQQTLKNHSDLYHADTQTPYGQNTPLHFAVIYNNTRALRFLVQHIEQGKSIEIQNADGKTPKDLALMYKSEEDKQRLLLILNRDFSTTQPISPSFRRKKFGGGYVNSNSKLQVNADYYSQNSSLLNAVDDSRQKLQKYVQNGLSNNNNKFDPIAEFIEGDNPLPQRQNQNESSQFRQFSEEQQPLSKLKVITTSTLDNRSVSSNQRNSDHMLPNYSKISNNPQLSPIHEVPMTPNVVSNRQNTNSLFKNQIMLISEPEILLSKDSADFQLKNRQESAQPPSDFELNADLECLNPREIELFIMKKQSEYSNQEKRLGQFNPDLYQKISTYIPDIKSKLGSPSLTSHNQSLNSSFAINAGMQFGLKRQQSSTRKKQQVEEIFKELDLKCKSYIDINIIFDKWQVFQGIMGENECKRLRAYIERYYKDTKITLNSFFKIMNFYISE
eukprot:403354358